MRCRIHCIPNHPRHCHIPGCLLHLDSNSMGLVCLLPPDLSHPLSIHSHNLPPLITGVCTMRHKHVHSPQHRVESPSRRGRRGIRTPSSQLYTLRTPSSPPYTLVPTVHPPYTLVPSVHPPPNCTPFVHPRPLCIPSSQLVAISWTNTGWGGIPASGRHYLSLTVA